MEADNFDPQAANVSIKPEICMRQMTHETILSCVRLQNNVSMARKMQPWQNTDLDHVDGKGYGLYGVLQGFYGFIHTDAEKKPDLVDQKEPQACNSN